MLKILKKLLAGFVMGIANVIPGVSGGTMAVVMGIYDRMIESFDVKNIKKDFKKKVLFLINVGIGVGIGILFFANVIVWLYDNFPIATNFAFMGLILGCIPMIFKRIGIKKLQDVSITRNVVPFVIALAFMIFLMWLKNSGLTITNEITTELTPMVFLVLMTTSFIGTLAMILPGISGSLILLVLGTYPTIIQSIADLNIPLIIPNAIGCAAGLLLGSAIMNSFLKKHPIVTYSVILGLVVGSIAPIYPGFSFDWQGLFAVLILIACTVLAYWFSKQGD